MPNHSVARGTLPLAILIHTHLMRVIHLTYKAALTTCLAHRRETSSTSEDQPRNLSLAAAVVLGRHVYDRLWGLLRTSICFYMCRHV